MALCMYDYFSNKRPFLFGDIWMWGYIAEIKPNIRWESFAANDKQPLAIQPYFIYENSYEIS